MDQFFSPELRDMISKSRLMALDLGFDYISTVHFFLADCESGSPNSIFNFAFSDRATYLEFKRKCTLEDGNWLATVDKELPLTLECERAIFRTDTERLIHKQSFALPCHFFLAAFDNPDSVLFDCFKDTKDVKQLLEGYYRELGEFDKHKWTVGQEEEAQAQAQAQNILTPKKKWYQVWK